MTAHKNPTAANENHTQKSCWFGRVLSCCQKHAMFLCSTSTAVDFISSGLEFNSSYALRVRWRGTVGGRVLPSSATKQVCFACFCPMLMSCCNCLIDEVFTSRSCRGYDRVVIGTPVPSKVPNALGLQCAHWRFVLTAPSPSSSASPPQHNASLSVTYSDSLTFGT